MYVGIVYIVKYSITIDGSQLNVVFIRGLGRLDLIHLLTWQKLKFYYQLKHTGNTVVFNVFQCLQYDCDYLQLCAIHSCRQFDSLGRLRLRIEEHFGEFCAAREFLLRVTYFVLVYF